MSNVYVLTFHGSVNYGAVLQAYALTKTINDMGYNCKAIDYNRNLHHKNYIKIQPSSLKGKIYQILKFRTKYLTHKKFDNFSKKYIRLTPESYDGFNTIESRDFKSDDIFIAGSDQIWNCELTENNFHYYFDFTDSKNKYSYAASFGVSDISNWKKKDTALKYLKNFKRISVREESASKIIKDHLNVDSSVVCDPTFLLDKDKWSQIAIPKQKDKYVLLFLLGRNDELIEKAKELAAKENMQVINIAYTVSNVDGAINVSCVSPEEWLGYIKNAECVFTNSFHGFALSLNFNKQFYVALSSGGRNSRIVDLAKRYGVEDRILNENCAVGQSQINYDEVNKKIIDDRSKSIRFLGEILNESNSKS